MRLRIVRRLRSWFHALLLRGGGRHVYSVACRHRRRAFEACVSWRRSRLFAGNHVTARCCNGWAADYATAVLLGWTACASDGRPVPDLSREGLSPRNWSFERDGRGRDSRGLPVGAQAAVASLLLGLPLLEAVWVLVVLLGADHVQQRATREWECCAPTGRSVCKLLASRLD